MLFYLCIVKLLYGVWRQTPRPDCLGLHCQRNDADSVLSIWSHHSSKKILNLFEGREGAGTERSKDKGSMERIAECRISIWLHPDRQWVVWSVWAWECRAWQMRFSGQELYEEWRHPERRNPRGRILPLPSSFKIIVLIKTYHLYGGRKKCKFLHLVWFDCLVMGGWERTLFPEGFYGACFSVLPLVKWCREPSWRVIAITRLFPTSTPSLSLITYLSLVFIASFIWM